MQTRKKTQSRLHRPAAPRARVRSKPKAATGDIVPNASNKTSIPPKWRHHFERLSQLRDYLLHRQGDLTKDATEESPTYSLHMADAGTDAYDRDFALGMLSAEQDAVYEIEDALNRIQNHTYGICEMTGQPIEAARLEAIPWTRFSTAAEKQLEHEGKLKHARLGARETVVARSETQNEPEEAS